MWRDTALWNSGNPAVQLRAEGNDVGRGRSCSCETHLPRALQEVCGSLGGGEKAGPRPDTEVAGS